MGAHPLKYNGNPLPKLPQKKVERWKVVQQKPNRCKYPIDSLTVKSGVVSTCGSGDVCDGLSLPAEVNICLLGFLPSFYE
jgi:hypothetical protein